MTDFHRASSSGSGALEISVFHGVLGGWGWEALGQNGELLAESQFQFESAEDCMQDALKQTKTQPR